MQKLTNKYILYVCSAIVICLLAFGGISYAIFINSTSQSTTNTMSALDCVDLSFTGNTSSISLTNTYPMTTDEGLATDPYNFTITNNCSNYVEYYLIGSVVSETNQLNSSYVKVELDGTLNITPAIITSIPTYPTPESLSSYTILNNYKLGALSLEANESQTMNFRMWLYGDVSAVWTDENVEGKNFTLKLSIVGVVKTGNTNLLINLPENYIGNYNTTFTGASWNAKKAQLEVSSVASAGINTINLTNITDTSTNLATKIISLSGTTQGTGEVVSENGYRYEGKNPNNYISFNGELWRILGVFDATSHGQNGQNLVKIVRNDSLGALSWDKNDTNDWPNSSLYHLLNENYYNGTNETTLNYCYGYDSIPAKCNFANEGITNSIYRGMIQNSTWYLGGITTGVATISAIYTYERGTTVYSGRSTSTKGKIGLLYLSDYGYSVLDSSCARTTNLSSYGTSTCAGQSWLYGNGIEWTIVPYSSYSSYVWFPNSNGFAFYGSAGLGSVTRPVLYLKSDVKTYAGDGSKDNPYIITE